MAELKTKPTRESVEKYLSSVEPPQKREDSLVLLQLMREITGETGVMWGSSMVGFGAYHYKSERSRQEGDWPLIAFSPRKQNITLYFMNGFRESGELLAKLGKHKTSVGCLYIKRLSDIDKEVLGHLIKIAYLTMKAKNSN